MTTPSESTVNQIMQSETFQITARALSSQLHISVKDAEQELIIEIVEHRHSLDDVAQRLNGKQRSEIVFAKKDLVRKQHKQDNAYMKLFTADADNNDNSITENVEATPARKSAYSDEEIQRALTVIPMAFTETTAGFINDVLLKGSEATKASRNMTTSSFNKKVKQTIKTAQEGNARKRLDKLLKSDTQLRLEENQQLAKTFIQMIEQEDTPKEWITKALQDMMDNEFFDTAFDACDYQGKIVKYWDTPETRQDCYKFINEVYKLTGDNNR